MYWACAQLEPQRERLAVYCLGLAGYQIYRPLLREQRRSHGRKILVTPPLFPGYLFLWVVRGWWDARWSPGVIRLIMDGEHPAHVPGAIIDEIRSRERGGFVELPKLRGLRPGMPVRVIRGRCASRLGCLLLRVRMSGCSSCCSYWAGSSGSSLGGARSRRLSSDP